MRCIFPFEGLKSKSRSLCITAWATNNKMLSGNRALTFMSTRSLCIAVFGIVLLIGSCVSMKKGPPKGCNFNGLLYNFGDTWNPFLLQNGYFRCIKCACKLSDDGMFELIDCSTCRTQSNPALPSAKEQQRSCTHKNISRNHGEVWKDVSTILLNDKQCKECSCTDGFVTCAIRTCPVLTCQNQTVAQGSCCPVCAGHLQTLRSPMGCDMMFRYYNHKETWHPEWPQANDLCITCNCQNSSVHCNKTYCPASTCANPQPKPGECCPSCRDSKPKPPSDCKWGGLTIAHNTSFSPPIFVGLPSCMSCLCNNSKIGDCKQVKCPTTLPCNISDTFKPPGKCCRVCKGDTKKNDSVHSYGNGICNVGSSRRLYEYQFSTHGGLYYHLQVALVDKANDFAQIFDTRANKTWKKPPTVLNTTKSNFDSIKGQNKGYKYIGKIKDGKNIKIMTRLQRQCGSQGCIHTLQRIMERIRGSTKCSPMVTATPPQTKQTSIAPPPHKILKPETYP